MFGDPSFLGIVGWGELTMLGNWGEEESSVLKSQEDTMSLTG